ncbi:SPFH domain-containing protein, partial [Peribacillus sp.]
MGFKDFIGKQFLDIIEWEDATNDTLVYKFPMKDNEIQNGAQLTVRPGQNAVFVEEGKVADVFSEGMY